MIISEDSFIDVGWKKILAGTERTLDRILHMAPKSLDRIGIDVQTIVVYSEKFITIILMFGI
jgi:hypothetical protein